MNTSMSFLRPTAVVLDDQRLFADAFAGTLEETAIFERVVSFHTEDDMMQFLIKFRSNRRLILFLEYYVGNAPITRKLNYIRRIQRNAHVVIVSAITNPVLIKHLLDYHPDGIVSKWDGTNEILDCIHALGKHEQYKSPGITRLMSAFKDDSDFMPLTAREIEILNYFAQGMTVNATAAELSLSRHTVAAHRRKMFEKIKVSNIAELLAYARKVDLL